MLVSVIIPTYNRAELVGDAVASVLAQTHADLELVVVDDGSTDATSDVLAGCGDPRLRVLRQENRGVSAARNAGAAASSGSMLALLDSDDVWLPEKLSLQLAYMEATGHEVSQTGEIRIRGDRRVNPMKKHRKPDGAFFRRALRLCLVSPSSVMMTRRVFEEAGPFDETLPACEDYDLWLRILLTRRVGLLDKELTVRRAGRPDQLSAQFLGMDLFRIRALVNLLDHPCATPWHRDCIREELAGKVRIYVAGCLKRGRMEEAGRVAAMARKAGVGDRDATKRTPAGKPGSEA